MLKDKLLLFELSEYSGSALYWTLSILFLIWLGFVWCVAKNDAANSIYREHLPHVIADKIPCSDKDPKVFIGANSTYLFLYNNNTSMIQIVPINTVKLIYCKAGSVGDPKKKAAQSGLASPSNPKKQSTK